jgi:hypothetical protein
MCLVAGIAFAAVMTFAPLFIENCSKEVRDE